MHTLVSMDVYVNKWATLLASTLLQLCAGFCYTFSLYAPALKTAFQLSQTRLEALGSALLSGGLFALVAGLVYDALYDYYRLGPRLVAGVGILLHSSGYGVIGLAAKGWLHVPYWGLLAAGIVAANGVIWLDSACVITCVRNTPFERGTIIGILKSFLGVSASVASAVYLGAFAPDGVAFVFGVATVPLVVAALTIPFLNHVPYLEQQEVDGPDKPVTAGTRYYGCFGLLVLLVIYQVATAAGELSGSWTPTAQRWLMWGVLALLCLLLLLPAGSGGLISKPLAARKDEETPAEAAAEEGQALLEGVTHPSHAAPPGGLSHADSVPEGSRPLGAAARRGPQGARQGTAALSRGSAAEPARPAQAGGGSQPKGPAVKLDMPDLALLQSLRTLNFWLLFSAFFTGMGSGFVFLNNLAQMVEALGGTARQGAVYVLLYTTFNSVGRAVSGLATERLLHRYGFPRTLALVGLAGATAVLGAWTALGSLAPWGLLPASVWGGFVFGCYWSLMPVLTSELFGLRHFASNQSVVHLAPTVGGLVLSTGLAGSVYDWHARRQGGSAHVCHGPECFRLSWLVVAALGLLQMGASGLLYLRTRHLYRRAAELAASYDRAAHAAGPAGGHAAANGH